MHFQFLFIEKIPILFSTNKHISNLLIKNLKMKNKLLKRRVHFTPICNVKRVFSLEIWIIFFNKIYIKNLYFFVFIKYFKKIITLKKITTYQNQSHKKA